MSTPETGSMRGLGGEALVAHNMRLLRKAARLSQEDLAQRMSRLGHRFHQTQIAKIERGERALRYDEVLALAKALGVPPVPFMTEALGEGAPEFELQEAEFRLQAAAQEWQAAHDHEQAARKRLDEVQREYDEIAERLGVSTGLVFYPAPGSPHDPLRPDAEESNDA